MDWLLAIYSCTIPITSTLSQNTNIWSIRLCIRYAVLIGITVNWKITVHEEYSIVKYIEQSVQYWPLRHIFLNIDISLDFHISLQPVKCIKGSTTFSNIMCVIYSIALCINKKLFSLLPRAWPVWTMVSIYLLVSFTPIWLESLSCCVTSVTALNCRLSWRISPMTSITKTLSCWTMRSLCFRWGGDLTNWHYSGVTKSRITVDFIVVGSTVYSANDKVIRSLMTINPHLNDHLLGAVTARE